MNDLKIVYMDPLKLTPYENNTKKHPDEQLEKIAGQIHKMGFLNPILVDRNYVIIAGHGRCLAAINLGFKQVPVIVAEHLTENEVRAHRIADNKLAESPWDENKLRFEIGTMNREGFDLRFTGFNEKELERYLEEREPIDQPSSTPSRRYQLLVTLNSDDALTELYNWLTTHEYTNVKVLR